MLRRELVLVVASLLAPSSCFSTPRPVPLAVRPAVRRCPPPRSIFTPAYDTTQRYSAIDWAKNMRTLPNSVTLRRIRSPLLANSIVTAIVCVLHATLNPLKLFPGLTPIPHTLLGSALGLLLVFRTNAAYDRFWEARKTWGTVTTECRVLASSACTYMTPQQALPMLTLIAAFPVVMKSYLRGQRDTRRLQALLVPQEIDAINNVVNQPQYVLSRLRQLAQQSKVCGVSEKEREMLFKNVATLGECVSVCERIYNTPIPLAYSRHTSRFLVFWLASLPLVLVTSLRWATLPVMVFICWALFGIFEIGNLIEEPFTAITDVEKRPLLPLTEVCRTIRRDVRAVAQYAEISKNYSAPVIKKIPRDNDLAFPAGFVQLKQILTQVRKEEIQEEEKMRGEKKRVKVAPKDKGDKGAAAAAAKGAAELVVEHNATAQGTAHNLTAHSTNTTAALGLESTNTTPSLHDIVS